MSLRSRIPPHRRRRVVQRLAAAGCLAAAASAAVVLDTSALIELDEPHEPAPSVATPAGPSEPAPLNARDELAVVLASLEVVEPEDDATAGDAEPAAASAGVDGPVPEETWNRVAECESGGDWTINTGNGYYGGLQFALSSWRWVGGTGYPHEASRETQIAMAQRLFEEQGWNAWPSCSRQLGLR